MKAIKVTLAALFVITAVFFLACDSPISLGDKLDLEGPMVDFTAPYPRKSVPVLFSIEGNASDKSGVDQMLLTAELNREPFAKQWRYVRGNWTVSEDSGATWAELEGAVWTGSANNGSWSIPVDMTLNGVSPSDGEYLFMIQTWDTGGFSDDNSFKTLVLIVDQNPPSVQVIDPFLYPRDSWSSSEANNDGFTNMDLFALHDIADNNVSESRNPANMGRFATRAFDLKWLIDDQHDIWSIDILLYEYNKDIDNNSETPVPDDYIYRYHENLGPPPATPDPASNIRPNGTARVPDLTGGTKGGAQGKDGEIKNPLTEKTTIRVVAVCYDAAGNANEERTLGYFVYWPKADEPWIAYTDGMKNLKIVDGAMDSYINVNVNTLTDLLMIFPGSSIKPTAYQAHGVRNITYTLYKCAENKSGAVTTLTGALTLSPDYNNLALNNPPRVVNGREILSTNFQWVFTPPKVPGFYVVTAKVYDSAGDYGDEEFAALFRVQDNTFPRFPAPPYPLASDPLYQVIGKANGDPNFTTAAGTGAIKISGTVDDAIGISALLMVWINPESTGYSAMSQLQYFTDPTYQGWTLANALTEGATGEEGIQDADHKNRIWKLTLPTAAPNKYEDPETLRQVYNYSLDINLATMLNIANGSQPLRSQMFLLKAINSDGTKSTIITYAPQGDERVPVIKITNVQVGSNTYTPGQGFDEIPKFEENTSTTITVNGTWTEDSTEYLDLQTYFYNNMEFRINGVTIRRNTGNNTWVDGNGAALTGITVSTTPSSPATATSGTFTITATVNGLTNTLKTSHLKDTLVVNASVRDFGRNPAEDGASWLIKSDALRFLRISSDDDDKAYRQGGQIKIYVEFNKPVVLARGSGNYPVLLLNVTGTGGNNNRSQRAAFYDQTQVSENTKHVFIYNVLANQNTPAGVNLNVEGISTNNGTSALATTDTTWQAANYPFTFVHTAIDNTQEEVRLTTIATHVSSDASRNGVEVTSQITPTPAANKKVFARLVPVGTSSTGDDYIFTLIGGKRISVDNTAPTITGITASPAGWHGAGVDIYLTATFSELVTLGNTLPRLTLSSANGRQTTNSSADVRVNNNQITFRYTVQANDDTNGNQLQVTNFTGNILDIPGNPMAALTTTTLTGVYIDTTRPAAPTVTVHSGTPPTTQNQIGTSGTAAVDLYNLYDEILYIRVAGASGAQHLGRVEYSLDNGANWTSSTTATTDIQVKNSGVSQVVARQTDQAGNVSSPISNVVRFNWDPGKLITRISSTSANGTYTNATGRNQVNVTLYFRKPLTFTTTPAITLNARQNNVTTTRPSGSVSTLSFTYTVASPDSANLLDVTNISGITASDGSGDVSRYLNGTAGSTLPAAGANALLRENKQIQIVTGALTGTMPTSFTDGSGDGIQSDGSYWTTLEISFNREITKGSGNITIEQIAGTSGSANSAYRLPTVLTETQYNRFRNVANFDTYYTKGTNGYINGQGSDTSAKYVLNYQYNPIRGATAAFTGDTQPAAAFFTAFREAEGVTLSVDSEAVTISGQTLKVRLSGSNALQVPGATYSVSLPAGFVIDTLGNNNTALSSNTVVLRGAVARPFVRIKRTQDIIATATAGNSTPRLTATQPFQAYVRIDCRTPNSAIVYNRTEGTYVVTDRNWTTGDGPNSNNTTTGGTRTRPTSATGTNYTNSSQIEIGNTNYGGYQWWVRAQASATVSGTSYTSSEAEEVAYRTAITYRLQGRGTSTNGYPGGAYQEIATAAGQSILADGDQIWIRGGDAIGSSSIPGFPFTWEDDWGALANKRAGIRLMTKVNVTTQTGGTNTNRLNNSQWQFLTWDMNAPAYVDFIRGRDLAVTENDVTYTASSIQQAWQYGPQRWAYQRSGWTSFKLKYPITPGEHRWLDTGEDWAGKYSMNFSDTFSVRSNLAVNYPNANQN
jgi:hypothetical protein